MVVLTNGEGAKGSLYLSTHCAFLRSDDQLVAACTAEQQLLRGSFPTIPGIHRAALAVSPLFRPVSDSARESFRSHLGLTRRDRMVVYAGRLSQQKNIHLLLDAFAQVRKKCPRAKLYLLGDIDQLGLPHLPGRSRAAEPSYAHLLALQTARLGIEKGVVFWGPASQEELHRFFAACDAQVSLTTHFGEDFGYSIAQGLATGVPTAVTRWGGGIDFIERAGAEPIPVRMTREGPQVSASACARAVLRLLEPARARRAREAALEFARQELAPAAAARVLDGIIQIARTAAVPPGGGEIPKPAPGTGLFLASQLRDWKHASGRNRLFASSDDPEFRRICQAYARARPPLA